MILFVIENANREVQKTNPKASPFFEYKDDAEKKLSGMPKDKQSGLKVQPYTLVRAVII